MKPSKEIMEQWDREDKVYKKLRKAGWEPPPAPVGTAVSIGLPPFTDEAEPKEP